MIQAVVIPFPPADRVQATLSPEEAARETWDVVIAGAGPAGSVSACTLARCGLSVLLVDKSDFPRDKVCGSCLNGAAFAALAAAGLSDLPTALGAVPLRRMLMRVGSREASIALPQSAALSRRAFDAALVRAAIHAGAAFLPGTEAELKPEIDANRTVELRYGPRSSRASVVVSTRFALAADGLAGGFLKAIHDMPSTVSPRAPLGIGLIVDDESDRYTNFYPAGTLTMGCTRSGYAGAVRLEDGRIDIAFSLDRGAAQRAGGVTPAAMQILASSGMPCPAGLAEATFRGTPFLTRRRSRVASEGLMVLGDAAGYIEPLTGEGMSWAMQQAVLAAPLVAKSIQERDPRRALDWQPVYERFIRTRCNVCKTLTWMRRNLGVGSLVVGVLSRMPLLASPWVRAINQASPEIVTI
jgi:flavin-dependent dehydrogenase